MLLCRAIHHGCCAPFKGLVESILGPDQLVTGLPHRDLDWVEVFSGKGHLSQAMADVACLFQYVFLMYR